MHLLKELKFLGETNLAELKYIPSLDGLRGIAILLVLIFHFGIWKSGWIGVQLFFVLSGYLISRILIASKKSKFKSYLSSFYFRRILRIFPIYFSYLFLISLCFLIFEYPNDFCSKAIFLFTYTFNYYGILNNYDSGSGLFIHLWSLSVEEQFYIFWPLLIFLFNRRNLFFISILIVVIIPFFRLGFGVFLSGNENQFFVGNTLYYNTLSHFDAFALGGLLNFIDFKAIRERVVYSIVMFSIILFLTLGLINSLIQGSDLKEYLHNLGYPFLSTTNSIYFWGFSSLNLLFASIILLLLYNFHKNSSDLVSKILSHKIIVFIGKISYGMYLYHMFIFVIYMKYFYDNNNILPRIRILHLPIYIALVVIVSFLSHITIESYFLRFKKILIVRQNNNGENP